MDSQLLEHYDRELRYLRELGSEFARDFPKVAGRLGLDAFECADPYVERLLEGFAFLAARVQLKMDAEFPRFTEQLLEALCPQYLAPLPSMAIVQLGPDMRQTVLRDGFVFPRGSSLRAATSTDGASCQYRTAHDVTLWPIELTSLVHSSDTSDLGALRAAGGRAVKATLRARFRTTHGRPFSELALDRLPFFVRGGDAPALRLFEVLLSSAVGVLVREPGAAAAFCVGREAVQATGFEDSEAVLPVTARQFQGYRLLSEYAAYPSRFMFLELAGLGPGVRRCTGQELEIVFALDRHDPMLDSALDPSRLALFCTPAVNLFPKQTDRIRLTDRDREYHVVADRARPMDFEVHSVLGVTGFGEGVVEREFRPFYEQSARTDPSAGAAYFTVHRASRCESGLQRTSGARSDYLGSETFVSLVDDRHGPYRPDLSHFAAEVLCTNRDLPLRLAVGAERTDFTAGGGAPIAVVRCVSAPTAPRPPHAWRESSWRLISHLTLNGLSLADRGPGGNAAALRELLELYADSSDGVFRRRVEGIRSSASRPVVRRLPLDGPPSFGRGVEITVECDELAFEGSSAFLLGLVLDRFFAKYVSINSFTETVLCSTQRGEIARWPLRIGRRPTL